MTVVDDLRIHAGQEPPPRTNGDLVLYWMQTTQRTTANFALEFAVEQANRLRLPLLVYHGLRQDYPWASDRFHTFILESVVDLYPAFRERGIPYAFYLEHPGDDAESRRRAGKPSPLVALARRAALVVTDFFPTFVVPRQIEALRAKVETPVIAIDSATVVPLRYHQREYLSAVAIRPRLAAALPRYLQAVDLVELQVHRPVDLPFEPTRPTVENVGALVDSCDIDHTVPPARALRGGATAAQTRLARFLEHGLPRYTEQRSDPNVDGTSRLSPYLHFGNISAQEVLLRAREAGPAVEVAKFQDELLTWRELSFNFVYFNPRHRTVEAIPGWARNELQQGEAHPRPVLYPDGVMEMAETGDELWNAAQRAYLVDGWMHNSLRMLWGKAILQWTPNAREALRILEHLNNKYSLDGRDPNTYGGIHWILGKFDRPFYRRPIYGTVRYQSLKAAAKKFDVQRYIGRFSQSELALSLSP